MIQTLALLLDSYRELNSKKLFWITLMLSGLVVAVFAGIGVGDHGMTAFFWEIPIPGINKRVLPPETFYKLTFVKFGIGLWLAWIATVLALVSTSPIFPDFLAGGAIELVLSKPIGRVRLFFTKYFVGLLFVALQVTVFTLACFLVIGLRGHSWDFRLFLAIPIVVCFFSYLFSICTLLGMTTRSTIASLLGTLLIWFFLFMLNSADAITLTFREQTAMQVEGLTRQVQRMEDAAAKELDKRAAAEGSGAEAPPKPEGGTHQYTPAELDGGNPFLPMKRKDLEDASRTNRTLAMWNRIFVGTKTALPKTSETIELLKRSLLTHEEMVKFRVDDDSGEQPRRDNRRHRNGPARAGETDEVDVDQRELAGRVEELIDTRSVAWVVGTSLCFEAFVLGIAAWMFARRDF